MKRNKAIDKHVINLGQLWANLASLDLLIRAYIIRKTDQETSAVNLDNLREGDVVKETILTSYHPLNELISDFNKLCEKLDQIDKDRVLRIRDSLAHGRVYSNKADGPMKLIKFGKPKDGLVEVKVLEEMNQEWFNESIKFLVSTVEKVAGLFNMIAPEK